MKLLIKCTILAAAIIGVVLLSCKKNEEKQGKIVVLPTVITDSIISIWPTAVDCKITVLTDSNSAVTDYGLCWSNKQNPTLADNVMNTHYTVKGNVIIRASNLKSNATYNIRGYATNSAGTAYGQQLTFTTTSATVTDYDGNVYKTVLIGNQLWLQKNLDVTHYRNGDAIPNDTSPYVWDNTNSGGYCNYNNDTAMATKFGRLYNFYAVEDSRNVCPVGWHVSTEDEWTALVAYLGGPDVAGAAIKDTSQYETSDEANNSSDFSALLGGMRQAIGFDNASFINGCGVWWTASKSDSADAYGWNVDFGSSAILGGAGPRLRDGYSVRCIRN
jgi:uncharacterized protein (TIGR02145 family)